MAFSLDPIGLLLGALGAGASLFKGRENSNAARLNAAIRRDNASIRVANADLMGKQVESAGLDADYAWARGAFEQGRVAREVAKTVSARRAEAAARGMDPDFGSPLTAQLHSVMQGEVDRELASVTAG